jgi:hypothetical protein
MSDRLVHHAEILSPGGDSYGLRDRNLGGPPTRLAPDSGPKRGPWVMPHSHLS